MASKPEHRERILDALEGGVVRAATLEDLRDAMGMSDVSKAEFSSALNSLRVKHQKIRVVRPGQLSRDASGRGRHFTVYLI